MRRYRVSVLDCAGNCYANIVNDSDIMIYTDALCYGSSVTMVKAGGVCITGLVTSITLMTTVPVEEGL